MEGIATKSLLQANSSTGAISLLGAGAGIQGIAEPGCDGRDSGSDRVVKYSRCGYEAKV